MSFVLLDTTDVGEAEAVLAEQFVSMRMSPVPGDRQTRTRVCRSLVGAMAVDDTDFNYEFAYQSDPVTTVMLTRIRSGFVTHQLPHQSSHIFVADDVFAVAQLGLPVTGSVHGAHYDVLSIEQDVFGEVAAGQPGSTGPVRITATAPVSEVSRQHLSAVVDDIRATTLSNPDVVQNPLIAGAMRRYLAASMLVAFPSTALLDPTAADRHDSTPQLLRRAIAFIEDNARVDICLADIARAIYVTPRALQYMFRKHRDCTPIEYLRRVRLHHAHHELIRSSRDQTTVSAIAVRWGFAHVGRFAVYYRTVYGQSPHSTLAG